MADYVLSAPLTGTKVEELLLRVNNNQDFTSAEKTKLAGLGNLYYDLEDTFTDTTTQTGVLSTPKTVLYGPLKTSPNGLIRVNADGIVDILATGPYAFKTRHRVTRTGASGVSRVFQWIEISTNGGSSWVKTGVPVSVALSGAEDDAIFFDFTPIFLVSGTKIRSRFARSATGADFGNLQATAPDATLIADGLASTPSAQLTAYRVPNWTYV